MTASVRKVVRSITASTKFEFETNASAIADYTGALTDGKCNAGIRTETWKDMLIALPAVRDALFAAGWQLTKARTGARSLGGCSGNVYWASFKVVQVRQD